MIANAASDKKALDIIIMKMKKMSSVCDFFVIASGTSTTQTRAIAEHIVLKLKEKGGRLWHAEGLREGPWILLDFGDVVAHIFLDQTRRFYALEKLWALVPQERFKEKPPATKQKRRQAPKRKSPAARKKKKRRKR